MEIRNFLISFLIFSLVIIVGTLVMGDFNGNYAGTEAKKFNTTGYNGFEYTKNQIDKNVTVEINDPMSNNTLGGSVSSSEAGSGMFTGTYQSFKLLRASFNWFQAISHNLAKAFDIPEVFINIAYAVFVIMIILAVIALIMGRTSV